MKRTSDERDWVTYNEQLVQRGEILLKLDVLKDWRKQVIEMNEGKRGRPFAYPDIMMLFYGMMRAAFHLPYRQLEGFARGLGKLIDLPTPDYSTFSLRLPQIKLEPDPNIDPNEPVVLAIDASGMRLTHKGQWCYQSLKRKNWVKIHVAVDVKSKQVISLHLSPGSQHDTQFFDVLVKKASERVKISKVLADCGYDSNKNHAILKRKRIESGILPRLASGLPWSREPTPGARASVVLRWRADPERWKDEVGYRQRQSVESYFAAFKRIFGECVQNGRWENVLEELYLKVWLYNLWQNLEGNPSSA